jgi:chromosome segregation ATPase
MDKGHDGITRRLSGAVKSEVEKSGCTEEIEVHGKLAYAHKDAVKKEIEKQLEGSSEAHRVIEREKETLGKKNLKALGAQADEVARTSYIVNVELAHLWNRMARLESEEKRVRRILEDELNKEREVANNPDLSKAEKKAVDKRIAAYEEALLGINEPLQSAREVLKDEGAGIDAIRKEYEDAIDSLSATYREKSAD